VDDTANEGEIVDEGGTFTSGADLTFGTANLSAYSYMAGGGSSLPLRLSLELIQDAAFDVQGLVSRKLGQRLARIQAKHLITGNGAGQPKGLIQGLTGVEIAADTAGITYADLVTFIHSVDPAYRASGCRWAFNDNTLKLVRLMEDAAGDPLWRPDSADMATGLGGGTLMGFPVTIDQGFPDVDVDANDVNWGVFGNLSEGYVIRRVRDIALIVNPWTRASYRQIEYSAWARMDATQQNTNAYVALTGEA
jgi:HK97 family phage major capsid protein